MENQEASTIENQAVNRGDCYAAYRLAGELFGRLREALGFGELTMTTRTWGNAARPSAVAYQWCVSVKGSPFCYEIDVTFREFQLMKDGGSFAEHQSEKWKRHHRGIAE